MLFTLRNETWLRYLRLSNLGLAFCWPLVASDACAAIAQASLATLASDSVPKWLAHQLATSVTRSMDCHSDAQLMEGQSRKGTSIEGH